jgi:hypothetical protein
MPSILGYVAVDPSGKILLQSGFQNLQHSGVGKWTVTFNVDVTNACEVATTASANIAGSAVAYGGGTNQVMVSTYCGLSPSDLAFQLIVVG